LNYEGILVRDCFIHYPSDSEGWR